MRTIWNKMAAHRTLKSMAKLVNSSRQLGLSSLINQTGKRSNSMVLKGLINEFSNSSKTSKMSSSSLQNIVKSIGAKNKQKFKIAEMQKCLAAINIISTTQMNSLVGSSSDGDLMEGSEEGDEVCSQGKKHSRNFLDTLCC